MNTIDDDNAFDELKEKAQHAVNYFEPAGAGRRFANYIIDTIAWYIIMLIIVMAIVYFTKSAHVFREKGITYLFSFSIMFTYYAFFEGLVGQTIGKMITKTKVIDLYGNKPVFPTILGRCFCRMIPFEQFSFLGNGVGWHDSITDTRVVSSEEKKVEELV